MPHKQLEFNIKMADLSVQLVMLVAFHFFEDFVLKQNSKKHIKAVTQSLKLSPIILIDIKWKGNVELGVIDYFENMGYSAYFTENHLWKNVLGILCWDLVFDENQTGIHHPFQWAPSHYSSEGFTLGKEKDFEDKISLLGSIDSFIKKSCQKYWIADK